MLIDVKTLDYGLGFQGKSWLVLRIHNWADRWESPFFCGFFCSWKVILPVLTVRENG